MPLQQENAAPRAKPSAVAHSDGSQCNPPAFRFRAIVVGAALIALALLWMYAVELRTGIWVATGVPALPALLFLALLFAAGVWLRRRAPRWAFSRAELIVIFVMVGFALDFSGIQGIRALMPFIGALFYYATPTNHFADYQRHIPAWWYPRDPSIIRGEYEGAPGGAVPWSAYALPVVSWTLFLIALAGVFICLLTLLRRQWTENERLTFPLVQLPLAMLDGQRRSFFADPVMWLGFGVAFLFNLSRVLHALAPFVPSPGFYTDLSPFFAGKWEGLQPVLLFHLPQVVGLAYLVPLDISFSVWAAFVAVKLVKYFGFNLGFRTGGFPYMQEQAAGGFIALALALLWMARKDIVLGCRAAFRRGPAVEDDHPIPLRWAVWGLFASLAFLLAWCKLSGMSLAVAAPFFFIVICFALVAARIRAEAGVPFHVVPWGMVSATLTNVVGTQGLLAMGGVQSFVLLSSLNWLGRFWLPSMLAESQIESFKLADAVGVRQRRMLYAVVIAVVIGIVGNFGAHIAAMFRWGELNVFHGGAQGSFNATVAFQHFGAMATSLENPQPPRAAQNAATLIGGAVTLGLLLLRMGSRFWAMSPIGYLAATCWGEGNPFWFGFFQAWLLKALILWIGGMPLYRRMIPAFLGLVLGHFAGAGMLMATLGLFLPDLGQLPSWF
ncbi:MAG: hypothetical protein JSV65_01310 [Armatimonadota bacterium]|nr:MAG: hypothetical protein JSV65_01310 [Armatimonadota bacterium]